MKILITLLMIVSSTGYSTSLETELVALAKSEFPHWGNCSATTVTTKALKVITLDCDNKSTSVTLIRKVK